MDGSRICGRRTRETACRALEAKGWYRFGKGCYDALGEERNLPEELRTLLARMEELDLVLVEMRDGRPVGSELIEVKFRDRGEKSSPRVWHQKRYVVTSGSASGKMEIEWWPEVRKPQETELFRVWPRLRAADCVIAGPALPGADHEDALISAMRVKPIREAAAHALRDAFTVDEVDALLPFLDDPEPTLRDAALGTIRRIAMVMECTPEKSREWWKGLSEAKRAGVLKVQAEGAEETPCWCYRKSPKWARVTRRCPRSRGPGVRR